MVNIPCLMNVYSAPKCRNFIFTLPISFCSFQNTCHLNRCLRRRFQIFNQNSCKTEEGRNFQFTVLTLGNRWGRWGLPSNLAGTLAEVAKFTTSYHWDYRAKHHFPTRLNPKQPDTSCAIMPRSMAVWWQGKCLTLPSVSSGLGSSSIGWHCHRSWSKSSPAFCGIFVFCCFLGLSAAKKCQRLCLSLNSWNVRRPVPKHVMSPSEQVQPAVTLLCVPDLQLLFFVVMPWLLYRP